VEPHALFSGMRVTVDGKARPQRPFVSGAAIHYPHLGCRIEILSASELPSAYHLAGRCDGYRNNILVNFHGHVVACPLGRISDPRLRCLVDLTGEPTAIRLMLPARTCLVENAALAELKDVVEKEAFAYLARRGEHELPYKEYQRAHELGIDLPEAKPNFQYGLLFGEAPEPIRIPVPDGLPLSKCHRINMNVDGRHEGDAANVHLLAALGSLPQPFVPVFIPSRYDGYSWADLPTIDQVTLGIGAPYHEEWVWNGVISCVDSIVIRAETSDGKVFSAPVCLAIGPDDESHVYVTSEAEGQVTIHDVWNLLGGWHEDDDSFDTQRERFAEELDAFWANSVGPEEWTRRRILGVLKEMLPPWRRVEVTSSGKIIIDCADGTQKTIHPPSGNQS